MDFRALKHVEVLFENRLPETLPDGAHAFDLAYEPFATHVVRLQFTS